MGILKIFKKKKESRSVSPPIQDGTKTDNYVSSTPSITPVTKSGVSTFTACALGNSCSNIEEVDTLENQEIASGKNVGTANSHVVNGTETSFGDKEKAISSLNLDKFLIDSMKGENGVDIDLSSSLSNSDCNLSSDDESETIHDDDNCTVRDEENGGSGESEDDISDSDDSLQAFYRYITCKPVDKTNKTSYGNSLLDDDSTVGSGSTSCDSAKENISIRNMPIACTTDGNVAQYFKVNNTSKKDAVDVINNIERSPTEVTVKISNSSFEENLFDNEESSKGSKIRSLLDTVCSPR